MVQIIGQESLGDILGQAIGGGAQAGLQGILQQRLAGAQSMTPFQDISSQLREREIKQKESHEEARKSEWEYSQHRDFRKEVSTNYKDALESEMRLNRMEELNKNGTLTGPSTAMILEKMGLPLGVLGNPDSEEFDKLSKDMLKNIRTYFGARINVVEVENFLKTIPSLLNSPEGRDRVINNLRMLLEPRKMMFDEYRKIKQESKESGKPMPIDLEETVIERIKPQLDELSKKFQQGSPQPEIAKEAQAGTFEKMPPAKNHNGTIIEDDKGVRYKSNGKTWRKI